ncbi:MAG TPA: 16S rRNA (cytosine(967)-C(5))-methyltransferase RsmB [Thiotrichales bacterium]|nr:16S rRNA (cytosine(967)-C(5))-methyltransferase RsmB [Thiotrichales bacterium]
MNGSSPKAAARRLAAAHALVRVVEGGRALPAALRAAAPEERGWVQEMAYGVCRWYYRLQAMLDPLLRRPLRKRDAPVRMLLLIGLYELEILGHPPHAVVHESVASAGRLRRPWAGGLVNAVLRGWLRQRERLLPGLEADLQARTAHPLWLVEHLRSAWPAQWMRICEAGLERPPMTLRVNLARTDRDAYCRRLREAGLQARPLAGLPAALVLERPVGAEDLPGFSQGLVSVQDAAAQLAAPILDASAGMRVLDACAAPGGKTAHLLEAAGGRLDLLALDREPARLHQLNATLHRLGLQAESRVADAGAPERWWDGRPFDRILLDAPCSATGVIRRQPDVKLHRCPEQIPRLVERQRHLLESLWGTLAPGGRLLYATCSVLPAENAEQIRWFLGTHADARAVAAVAGPVEVRAGGTQILPGTHEMDGFYYALLEKRNT